MTETKNVSQETPTIPLSATDAARVSSGAYVVVKGDFLIEQNIAETWAQWRKVAEWPFAPKGFVDGKITADFEDHIFISLAEQIGLISAR